MNKGKNVFARVDWEINHGVDLMTWRMCESKLYRDTKPTVDFGGVPRDLINPLDARTFSVGIITMAQTTIKEFKFNGDERNSRKN